jgi:hypothetical protein
MMINARKKNLPYSAMNVDKNILIKNLTFDFFFSLLIISLPIASQAYMIAALTLLIFI